MDPTTTHVLIVAFIATLIRSTFGFGEAMVAVPLFALKMPIEVAAPVAVLLSITVAVTVVAQDWRDIEVKSLGWLIIPALFGTALGIEVLTKVNQHVAKMALALVILAFSSYCLVGKRPPELRSESRLWLVCSGFLSGILGGAYGMNGPPLAIYGSMRRWSPQHFRANLQSFFLPASLIVIAGYWLSGLWVPAVTHYYLISLFVAIPAIFIGRVLNRRLHGETFLKLVHGGLVCIALALIVQQVHHR